MSQVAKLLRWYFGIEAVALFGVVLLLLWRTLSDASTRAKVPSLPTAAWLFLAALIGTQLALGTVSGMAWWTLGRRKASARIWAIIASLANIPVICIGRTMWLPTAVGIAGVVVFSHRDALARMAVKSVKPPRLPGDGTSRLIDTIAVLIACAGVFFGAGWWDRWGIANGLPTYWRLPQIVLACLILTAVHEFGHASVGWAVGMKLHGFLVGPFHWRIRDGRWIFRFDTAGLLSTGGGAGLVPTSTDVGRRRDICVLSAGPFANLLLGSIALWAALTAKHRPWEQAWQLFALIATLSLIAFVVNLLPLRPEGAYSDGARIYQLLHGGPWVDIHRARSMVASSLVTPLRPKDFDIDAIQRAARLRPQGEEALVLRLYAYSYFFDSHRIAEALEALQAAESVYEQSASRIPAELHTDFIFGNAFLKHDAAKARVWWDRMEARKERCLNSDYWRARSALLWSENRLEPAREAWEKGNALAQKLPSAGAYEFDRYCFTQLRQALDASSLPT